MRPLLIFLACLLSACSNPMNAPVPKDLANIETLKPVMEKLKPEERDLLASYLVRHTVGAAFGAAFGVKADPVPDGMTVGKAIEEQRAFAENQKAEAAAKKVAIEKIEAQRKALAAQMKQVLGVRLVDVSLHKASFRDDDVHSRINFEVEIENKGAKDITGIKGMAVFRDKFGDTVASVGMKSEATILAGKTATLKLSKDYSQFNDVDRKLANLDANTVNFELAPEVVLFSDGSKFEAPKIP